MRSVQEIGSWSTKIKDDYNDISSNHDLKEVDHVSESNDEQPIDDFEILQTKLNNMDEQAFDNELGTEGDKKDGENRHQTHSFHASHRWAPIMMLGRHESCQRTHQKVDLPNGGRSFTWIKKQVPKLSKHDRFLFQKIDYIGAPPRLFGFTAAR
ncbi:hypothetical protein Tco_0299755 [Tanacetum coccineum]